MLTENYIAGNQGIPNYIVTLAEAATFAFSLVGMFVAISLYLFFKKDKTELSSRLRCEYITDFWLFVTLAVMGFALYFNMPLIVKIDVILRPFVMVANIYAMWRLYKHFKDM